MDAAVPPRPARSGHGADIVFRSGAPCAERGSLPGMLYYSTGLAKVRRAVESGHVIAAVESG